MKRWCDFATCWIMREAVAMAAGKKRDDLDTDRQLNLALVRMLEIVGEADAQSVVRQGKSIHPAGRARF
jgi:uncharacterized protein with HEPN domain